MTDLTTRDLSERYPDDRLKNRIIHEIAKSYPFSIEDIRAIYDVSGSFDTTIEACHNALVLGVSNPMAAANLNQRGPFKPGPSETK